MDSPKFFPPMFLNHNFAKIFYRQSFVLYGSEIHSKNIEIYLSKLYIAKYSEVNDVISTRKNIASVNSINAGCITNYITCASGCFAT